MRMAINKARDDQPTAGIPTIHSVQFMRQRVFLPNPSNDWAIPHQGRILNRMDLGLPALYSTCRERPNVSQDGHY